MVQSILIFFFVLLILMAVGAFVFAVIDNLTGIRRKTDTIPEHHWGMTVYMYDVPGKNTERFGYTIQIYEGCDYSELPVPHKGEEVSGVYYIDDNKVEMTGIVDRVHYSTDDDWIMVRCKCTDVKKVEE